ncbi:MAG: Ig-like domain-containing protein [Mucinivorans sp.]
MAVKRLFRFLFWLCLAVVPLFRCATISSPTGGPRDSSAPILLRTIPAPYTTNFTGKRIELCFNEYVQLKDQSKFFMMSPPAQLKPVLTLKGRSVVVEFQEPLDSNATYRLDFGSSIVDNNEGNKMVDFTYTFSTGPVVDSLLMAGQMIDAFTRDTIISGMIFFFDAKADSLSQDSVMFRSRAEALFRSDSSGYFVADILRDKPYRIYGLADENGNQLYEPGTDMIAFADTTFNPMELDGFLFEYDSLTRRAELSNPQVVFELFKEEPVKRQTLIEHKRPMRQKLTMVFNAPHPTIDTLNINGVPDGWLIKDWNKRGDSLTMWVNPPTKDDFDHLADTLRARLSFQKHDSVWQFFSHGQNLSFNYKAPIVVKKKVVETKVIKQTRKNRRKNRTITTADSLQFRRDSLAMDSAHQAELKALNPFKFTVNAKQTFVPLDDIIFDFDVPVLKVDPARIKLDRIHNVEAKGKSKARIDTTSHPFTFVRDSSSIYRWRLHSKWTEGDSYRLFIPDGVFNNIAYQSNDTLKSTFTVAKREKYGTLNISMLGDTSMKSSYILELVKPNSNKKYSLVRRVADLRAGQKFVMPFVDLGEYRLRVIEDRNHNGVWDTGSLTMRRYPERVRMWSEQASGVSTIVAKENWEIEVPVDLKHIFIGHSPLDSYVAPVVVPRSVKAVTQVAPEKVESPATHNGKEKEAHKSGKDKVKRAK